jgi:hypothetical protein
MPVQFHSGIGPPVSASGGEGNAHRFHCITGRDNARRGIKMKLNSLEKSLLLVAFSVVYSWAASSTVGVVRADGLFTVNNAQVEGNANLLDGSHIQTNGNGSGQIYLQNGQRLELGLNSAGTVYGDHFTLTQGTARIDSLKNYKIDAGSFSIQSSGAASHAVVHVDGNNVDVLTKSGRLNITNEKGQVTHLANGEHIAFKESREYSRDRDDRDWDRDDRDRGDHDGDHDKDDRHHHHHPCPGDRDDCRPPTSRPD